jgi:hypothetical protein
MGLGSLALAATARQFACDLAGDLVRALAGRADHERGLVNDHERQL